MKRIKIIDLTHYEPDPSVIVEQLADFLKSFRKNKPAGLIDDDTWSAEFEVFDLGIFTSYLSEGDAISFRGITLTCDSAKSDRPAIRCCRKALLGANSHNAGQSTISLRLRQGLLS